MSDPALIALEALQELTGWRPQDVCIDRQLGDGLTNQIWQVRHRDERFVLRRTRAVAATVGQSLANELKIVEAAARRQIAPEVVAADVERGIVLSRYITGRVWSAEDMHDSGQLTRLAKTLGVLHQVSCDVPYLDVASALRDYARRSGDPQAGVWRDRALAHMEHITPRERVLCHNDMSAANIIDTGELYLIDWEYAALGDPLFDLAVVVAHHKLDDAMAAHLLRACAREPDLQMSRDLRRWCEVYRCMLALWQTLALDVSKRESKG